ncbi:MAG: 23S rRNA (uracil(1939)-C(5))-methyltransferase RlmD [Burkholderiales bacterium]|jgi:23S rRNA (uracil1939-C5)-methyltransferase|nr:23S rRNA (uracil(1939)-C(5))-methyltransferase RlmD [Burkholderiales bacterium]
MPYFTATIESLDQEGRGIARCDGKTVFVEGALAGETVVARTIKRKPSWNLAQAETVLQASADRVRPNCPHFGVCGGCSMQHAGMSLQVAAKQRVLEDALSHIGNVRAEQILAPVYGVAWGYRFRARLSVRHVVKKGGVLIGFHEKRSSYVADMRECPVLPPPISDLLPRLRTLVERLSIRDRLPQIEVAVGEQRVDGKSQPVHTLILRILGSPDQSDQQILREFSDSHQISFWLQTGGIDTAQPFYPADSELFYTLPEFNITIPFVPTDFTQVNHNINRVLVRKAVTMLAPTKKDRIADLFCGLGNFTLPIARSGAQVIGIEGNASLVARARQAARHNALGKRCIFQNANLFKDVERTIAPMLPLDKILIDPPREGAIEVVKALPQANDRFALKRIVYVSCNPATLARDTAVLVHNRGYRLKSAGIVNMFPHTVHVESMAIFEPY